MAEQQNKNPLLSTQKSDSGLQISLHPLVLLTISDYITRHALRELSGPIVGALLGQSNGREITIEHAFECLVEPSSDQNGSEVLVLSKEWFDFRLQQMRDVHKVPPLDLVGWFTLIPSSGPQPHHLPLHQQILKEYNESAILLGFHPADVATGSSSSLAGKLPITIYESNLEADTLPAKADANEGEDQEMKDGDEEPLKLRFKELPYTIETSEAEMISVDFVARGGTGGPAVEELKNNPAALAHHHARIISSRAGKQRESDAIQNALSSEEQELIASLTAKANAIKMLHSRISILTAYLENLPPSYVATGDISPEDASKGLYAPVNHSILRSIQALLTRLTLVVPTDNTAFAEEVVAEQNDVHLVDLFSKMTQSIKEAKDLGMKYHVVDKAKTGKQKQQLTSVVGRDGMNPQTWEGNMGGMGNINLGNIARGQFFGQN